MAKPGRIFSVEVVPSFRDTAGVFRKGTKELLEDRRVMMRHLGRRLVSIAQSELESSTSAQSTGKHKQSIRFRTFRRGTDALGFTVTAAQPLDTFIQKGTKRHVIRARKAKALFFFFGKIGMNLMVPKNTNFNTHVRGNTLISNKGFVNHPGTKPNPYMPRALKRWEPEADTELNRMTNRWTKTVTA